MCSIFAYGLGFLLVYFYARLRQWLVTFCFEVDGLRPGHAVRCDVNRTHTHIKRRLADVPDHDLIPATSPGESRGRGGERPTPKRQERATRKRPASTANLSEGAPASAGQRVRKAMDG